ncbi:hypothetical protein CAT7_00980 [Carnobacterium sp. AT7]|uniref:glycosyltransferase n=1 Tax=Carnobacterium sp. AT7 TaxID=333990 RepID=UPI00015F17E8|nr:glycosyltransferase [Carnobacterium sp. AT7]EDP68089.1 hypothetical protein CAT7_00980 [Carnobacterium sp. AT7]
MKIVVVDFAAKAGGALSVLKDFAENVKKNDKINDWYFILSGKFISETPNIHVIIPENIDSNLGRLKFDFITGSKIINSFKPDVVFSMQNTTTYRVNAPVILYLHQPLPFQNIVNYSLLNKNERSLAIKQKLVGALIKNSLPKVANIIVQTEWMRQEVLKYANKKESVFVIQPNIHETNKAKLENIRTNHFFYPTSDILYKNIAVVEEACKKLDNEFPLLDYAVNLTIDRSIENEKIHSVGQLSRIEVLEKLETTVLLFPSYVESFGLPLLEARQTGTFIIAASTPFAHEILNNYENVIYFDPFNAEELKGILYKSIHEQIKLSVIKDSIVQKKDSWDEVRNIIYRSE